MAEPQKAGLMFSRPADVRAAVEDPEDFAKDEVREDTILAIPRRFRWATLGRPFELEPRVRPSEAVKRALGLPGASNVVILGTTAGVGKTSLGCALLRRMATRRGEAGYYADAIDLAYARKMWPLGKGEAPEVLAAMEAGVLFLDELGAEQGMDQTIEQIIRKRHNADRLTIFGTPCSVEQLVGRYNDGLCRRVLEQAEVIELGGA